MKPPIRRSDGWLNARDALYGLLCEHARTHTTRGHDLTYGEVARYLVSKFGAVDGTPIMANDPRLHVMLADISRIESKWGRGLLSVLVVNKEDRMPGSGFFAVANELGRPCRDKMSFWLSERERVYREWKTVELRNFTTRSR